LFLYYWGIIKLSIIVNLLKHENTYMMWYGKLLASQ